MENEIIPADRTDNYRRFKIGLERLIETFGENQFKKNRVSALWDLVKMNPIEWFESCSNMFIKGSRSAPLPKDFDDFNCQQRLQNNTETVQHREYMSRMRHEDMMSQLTEADRIEGTAFSKECLRILNLKLDGKINLKQFHEACDLLDLSAKQATLNRGGKLDPWIWKGERFVRDNFL